MVYVLYIGAMENPFESLEQRLDRIESKLDRLIENIENPKNSSPVWLSTKQLAAYLGFSTTAITNLRISKIPFYKLGGRVLFKKQEIEEWIEKTRHKTGNEHLDDWLRKDNK